MTKETVTTNNAGAVATSSTANAADTSTCPPAPRTTKTQVQHGELFITVPTRLKLPQMPNFIRTMTDECIPLGNLTKEQIEAIGQAWARELLSAWIAKQPKVKYA